MQEQNKYMSGFKFRTKRRLFTSTKLSRLWDRWIL